MARMTEAEIVGAIYSNLERSTDYANTQLREIRKKSWDRHLQRPRGDEMQGRSKVLDTSIADTTESIMAILSETWHTENICDFAPQGPNDEDSADAEARALNSLFWSDNNGYLELMQAAKNALMFRNGVVKVWVDDQPEYEVRTFPDAAALAAIPEDQIVKTEENEYGTQVTIEIPQQKLCFKAIEPAYFTCDPNLDTQDLQQANFISERVFFTRAELREMGVSRKVVLELPESTDESVTDGVGQSNTDIMAKLIDGQSDKGHAPTPDQQLVQCHWVHMTIALDGSLNASKWRFLVSNRRLLLKSSVTHWPYASGAAWIVPNRWSGLGVYDKLIQTEDMRTNAMRQLADNLNLNNNPRLVADPATVDFESLLASAPGRPIQKKRADAIVDVIPTTDLVSNSIAFLQYTENLRGNQAGAALDMQSGDAQSVQNISGISAELQLGPAEAMTAMIGRNLAESMLKGAFLVAHRCIREYWRGPLMFYRGGEWQETEPASWMPRKRISLNIAMSPGESRRKVAAIDWVINMQMTAIQGGAANIMTSYNHLHKAITDRMRLTRLDDSEGYFIDPESQEAQEAMQAQAEQAQQTQAMQAQMAQMQFEIEQFKAQDSSQKWQAELQHDYYETNLEAEVKEAEIVERGITATRQNTGPVSE